MKKPPLEKSIVNRVKTMILQRGGFAVKIHGGPQQEKGVPDLLCCYRGRFIALEGKRSASEEPTMYQNYQLERIRKAGGVALRIHTVEQAKATLDRIDEELGPTQS